MWVPFLGSAYFFALQFDTSCDYFSSAVHVYNVNEHLLHEHTYIYSTPLHYFFAFTIVDV